MHLYGAFWVGGAEVFSSVGAGEGGRRRGLQILDARSTVSRRLFILYVERTVYHFLEAMTRGLAAETDERYGTSARPEHLAGCIFSSFQGGMICTRGCHTANTQNPKAQNPKPKTQNPRNQKTEKTEKTEKTDKQKNQKNGTGVTVRTGLVGPVPFPWSVPSGFGIVFVPKTNAMHVDWKASFPPVAPISNHNS